MRNARQAVVGSFLTLLTACASGQDGLDALHADIVSDYPSVSHVSADALPAGDVLFLDIRDPEEFAVSHIPGAVRVSLGTSPEDVMARLGDVSGKEIVAYCSVGRRSSIFAKDMQDALAAEGAMSVVNLEGGLFGWHAERRALENETGQTTDVVHPYDEIWKRYVPRQDAVSYTPETVTEPTP
jgi:rhodanese-related sulfurtransferase